MQVEEYGKEKGREGMKERKKDRYSLRTRECTRWSFVRCEIHSAFTYRRTSAIVNSLNKLFQLQEQRRCNIESHSQWRIGVSEEFSYPVESRKAMDRTIGALGHEVWTVRLPVALLTRPSFRTIVQLILIPFRPKKRSSFTSNFHLGKVCYIALIKKFE